MMNIRTQPTDEASDSELVAQSLAGNRDAFGQIVSRYQTLICSLAYSATGSLALSEDLSQETFLAAWKQLPGLREPGKLRSWLCGIARNLHYRARRTQSREPVDGAETMDAAHDSPAVDPLPRDQTISREEEAILWRSLDRIPDTYREPLILFYREQQSVERVARVLDLSEDVVRQRLSRGRKLLQEEVTSFVEGALRQTAPGSAFSSSVLAAIPVNGAGLAVGLGAAKSGGLLSLITLPVVGLLGTIAGSIGVVRDAPTPAERQSKKRTIIAMWIDCAGLWAGLFLSRFLRVRWGLSDHSFVGVQFSCYLIWATIMAPLVVVSVRRTIANHQETGFAPMPLGGAKRKLSVLLTACAMTVGALAWLVHLAWQVGDTRSSVITAATGIGVIAWCVCCSYFPSLIKGIRAAPAQAAWVPTILIVAVILLMLNWRLDRWTAVILNSDLAGAHLFLPMWIIHLSTLFLLIWIGVLVTFTRPARPAPKHTL